MLQKKKKRRGFHVILSEGGSMGHLAHSCNKQSEEEVANQKEKLVVC